MTRIAKHLFIVGWIAVMVWKLIMMRHWTFQTLQTFITGLSWWWFFLIPPALYVLDIVIWFIWPSGFAAELFSGGRRSNQ